MYAYDFRKKFFLVYYKASLNLKPMTNYLLSLLLLWQLTRRKQRRVAELIGTIYHINRKQLQSQLHIKRNENV